MMEAASTFETLVNVYQSIRRYNPVDSHFYLEILFETNFGMVFAKNIVS
jgi:hypothetical protein